MLLKQILVSNLFLLLSFVLIHSNENELIDSLLQKLRTSELEDTTRFSLLYSIASNYNNADSSISYSKKLIEAASKKKDFLWEYRGYLQLGNAYNQKGNYNDALKALFKSAQIADFLRYNRGKSKSYVALAGVYTLTKNYTNAIQYYDKSLEVPDNNLDANTIANIFLNKGSLFLLMELPDSALILFNNAYNVYLLNDNIQGMAYSLGLIARTNADGGDLNKSKELLEEAINLLDQVGDYYAISSFQLRLAIIEQKQFDYKNALRHTKESLNISTREKLLPQQRDACERLASIYSEINDFTNAYKYKILYYSYRDSIINEETIRKMADLRTEYEVSQKQAEIDILTKKRKVQQIIGIGLSAIIIISGVLLTLLYRNSRRNRKLSELLVEQKAELQLQHDQLEELNKTKDRFFSIISHDLRGPIGVLNGTTMLIREYLESKDYKQLAELTANMEYSVKKVQHLLDNLLEWAISQQGKFNYQPEKVELNEVVHEAMGIFEGMAIAKNISFHFVCKFDKFFIVADRNSLLTILRNLISNAIKFTPRNGSITVMAYKSEKNVIIKVSDTGVGIAQKTLRNLFKIDENKSTWGTEREKGLGLGLTLVNEFVKMNHGTIDVESEEGVGSTFTVKFPTEAALKKILLPQDI
jgi:signal transduction histidine kinase